MGLGQGVTAGLRPEDRAGRRSLLEIVKSGQALERRFATIALAESSARRGPVLNAAGDAPRSIAAQDDGEEPGWEGLDLTQRALLRNLGRGRADVMPWFAMALGIQRWHLEREGVPWNRAVGAVLREKVRSERSASYAGAYAMACALTHRGADEASLEKAGVQVHRAFLRTKDPIARGQMAIALGWLDYEPARKDLVKLMRTSRFQPELLWSASIALVLARDSDVVPLLIDTLTSARSASGRGAAAAALGRVGDERATEPLLGLLADEGQPDAARTFAIVGLGLLCEPTPLPWRTPVAHANPYFAVTGALTNGSSGILDLN